VTADEYTKQKCVPLSQEETENILFLTNIVELASSTDPQRKNADSEDNQIYLCAGFYPYGAIPPWAFFGKSKSGIYYLSANPTRLTDTEGQESNYYAANSLQPLISIALDMFIKLGMVDTSGISWIEIK
jgi:hypothetical protein